MKELLYLDASGILKQSQLAKPEDSLILPRRITEATDWFSEAFAEFKKKQHR